MCKIKIIITHAGDYNLIKKYIFPIHLERIHLEFVHIFLCTRINSLETHIFFIKKISKINETSKIKSFRKRDQAINETFFNLYFISNELYRFDD